MASIAAYEIIIKQPVAVTVNIVSILFYLVWLFPSTPIV